MPKSRASEFRSVDKENFQREFPRLTGLRPPAIVFVNLCDKQSTDTAKMPSKAPRLLFKQLKGFKAISDDDKIETSAFLIAAREVVALIGEYMIQYFECEPEQTHNDACCVGPSLNFYCFHKYRMKWGRERRGGGEVERNWTFGENN